MAEFYVSGRMKVKTFKKDFKEAFNASLRVYNGRRLLNEWQPYACVQKII
jgi:hypothetical protein